MRRTITFLLMLCALTVAAGCGGGGGGDKKDSAGDAEATVKSYLAALVAKDGKGACDRLTPEYQRSVVQQNESFAKQAKADNCAKLIDAITRSAPSVAFEGEIIDSKGKVDALELETSVRDSGSEKNATVTGAQGIQRYQLETRGGRWLISKIERTG